MNYRNGEFGKGKEPGGVKLEGSDRGEDEGKRRKKICHS